MADPTPTDLAARRAERARRNGALSRGPASARGKQRSSRNALRHGLTAKVHLVLHRDDEADFKALAQGLDGELAPRGTLEGFLVARLTAAMWHAGRSERMEARAFAAGTDPDPDRLRLALRYRGSVQRELFRCLGALQDLRRRPLELPAECNEPAGHDNALPVDADAIGAPAEVSAASAMPAVDLARVAVAAWGGERAAAVPPGFLELRPVRGVWPIGWRFVQERAFPGDVPLLVYADGTVRSPDGELLEDVWSPGGPLPPPQPYIPTPPSPVPAPPRPAPAVIAAPHPPAPIVAGPMPEPSAVIPAPASESSPKVPPPLPEPELSALDWLDGDADEADEPDIFDLMDDPPPSPRLRNEPTQPVVLSNFLQLPQVPDGATPTQRLGLGRTPPDFSSLPPEPDAVVEPLEPHPPVSEPDEAQDGHEPPPPASAGKRPRLGAWERMWGITLPEPESSMDDTFEPEAAQPREQKCTNELPPCTFEPGAEGSGPCPAELNSEAEDGTALTRAEMVEHLDDRHPDQASSSAGGWQRGSSPRGRIRRRHSRTLPPGSQE